MHVLKSLSATVLLTAAVGCQNTREGLEKDAEAARPKVERAAEETAAATREAAKEVSKAAEPFAEKVREGAVAAGEVAKAQLGEAVRHVDAAQQTAQIKTELMADKTIDSTTIDVDTHADTRTIELNGTVRTATEKATAGRIATAKAPGYTVVNKLTVRP